MLDASEALCGAGRALWQLRGECSSPNCDDEPEMLSVTSAERKFRGGLGELIFDAMRPVVRAARPGGFIFGLILDYARVLKYLGEVVT